MARVFECSSTGPIVETKAGKIRGFRIDSTYTFWGIKYANAKRWEMPTEVEPWEGVEDALSYGYVSPMLHKESNRGEIMCPHRYWVKDENCQYLNVWTQSLDETAKKPVMVWLHGGGWAAGSSIEQVAYDGENLSKFGDVVVVSINHRLNILGYLDLSAFSDKYWNSGNVGNADIVASLQWIHDNIAKFGGDPDNVTIFGQSGGGGKVHDMIQTPAADGLFHKGIIMSGMFYRDRLIGADSPELNKAVGEKLMAGCGVKTVEELAEVPYDRLAEAYNAVAAEYAEQGIRLSQMPHKNEWFCGDALKYGFREHAADIPVIIGSVMAEMSFGTPIVRKHELTEEQQLAILKEEFGEKTDTLVALYKAAYPDKNLTDLLLLDTAFREAGQAFALERAKLTKTPIWEYIFTYEFPIEDGKAPWHCSDIAFFFHNTDKVVVGNKPGVSDKLEEQMSGAFVNFARCGDPNTDTLPEWNPDEDGKLHTMLFDEECKVVTNHDLELYKEFMPVAPDPRKRNRKNISLH